MDSLPMGHRVLFILSKWLLTIGRWPRSLSGRHISFVLRIRKRKYHLDFVCLVLKF